MAFDRPVRQHASRLTAKLPDAAERARTANLRRAYAELCTSVPPCGGASAGAISAPRNPGRLSARRKAQTRLAGCASWRR
jgi:hypothetical protein